MTINNIEGLTMKDLQDEIDRGGKFVMYQYCISILILTFRQPTEIYFIRGHENAVGKGISYSLISFVAGWWGIPWGPIYTVGSLINNFKGGKDVTAAVMQSLQQASLQVEQAPKN